jgi:hypothetical protein
MDEIVALGMAKWPNVPAVYGWLQLDRRGNWRIKGERIGNAALRDFICRNYQADARGCWFFQNGPQRVFVELAYTPRVVHYEGEALADHCGRRFASTGFLLDDEGSVLVEGEGGVALLDDRDLQRLSESVASAPVIRRAEVAGRFGFVAEPRP